MPTVRYQPNQIGPVETTNARFRAADNDGGVFGAMGKGLQSLGAGIIDYAQVKDAGEAQRDEENGRAANLPFRAGADRVLGDFSTLEGKAAVDGAEDAQRQLAALKDQAFSQLGTARSKKVLNALIAPSLAEYQNQIASHLKRQQSVMAVGNAAGEVDLASNAAAKLAADLGHPDIVRQRIEEARAANRRLGQLKGLGAAAQADQDLKVMSGIHSAALSQMVAKDEIQFASAYFDAHEDEMTVADRNEGLRMLKGPLELRDSAAGFAEVVSGAGPASAAPAAAAVAAGKYQAPVAGRVTNTEAQHVARGSHGLDIAAPMGSAVLPIAGGQVVQVGQDARSGKFVIVKHADGHTSSYSHLGNQSVKQGDAVTASTVLGSVGVTGHTTGPHLHLRTKDASGKDVDPQSLFGRQSPAGTVIGTPQTPRNFDQGAVISAIDKRNDWSFEKRQRVKAYARQQMGEAESLLADQRQDAAEEALKVVNGLGDGYRSLEQIPANIRARMSPEALERFKNAASAGGQAKANGPTAMTLNQMRVYEPDKFMTASLAEFAGRITPAELDTLFQKQAEMRVAAKRPAQAWSPLSGIGSAVTIGKRLSGLKLSNEEESVVLQTMESQANALYQARGKKPLDPADYDALFKSATRTVATKGGWFSDKGALPIYSDRLTIPADWRADAAAKWKRETGKTATEEELLRLFRATYRFQSAGRP